MIHLVATMGDPAGIGPEVVLKTLASPLPKVRITVIGDRTWLKRLNQRARLPVPWKRIHWVDLANLSERIRPGRVQAQAGRAAFEYLEVACQMIKRKTADALVTAPVCKESIVKAGIPWIGHTEYLAKRFGCATTMMFVTGKLRISLVTTHCALKDLPSKLTREKIIQTVKATRQALVRDFKIRRPRIGLAALNPHAGEGGLFGQEEKKVLAPAVRALRACTKGSDPYVHGPLPVDSLMQAAACGQYDAVVAPYHDQALIPVKLLGWDQSVNVTLGLPFVRTSPVHGTAFDLAGKGQANPASMRSALRLAAQLTRHER